MPKSPLRLNQLLALRILASVLFLTFTTSLQAQNEKGAEAEPDQASHGLVGLSQVELLARAAQVERQLETFREVLKVPTSLGRLQTELEKEETALVENIEDARERILRASRWFVVADIRFVYSERLRELRRQKAPFERFVARVGHIPKQLEHLQKEWELARDGLKSLGGLPDTQARVARLLRDIRLTRLQASSAEALMVRVGALSERMEASLRGLLELTNEPRPALVTDFDYRPQVENDGAKGWLDMKQRFASTTARNLEWARKFAVSNRVRIGVHAVFFILLLGAMRRARAFHNARIVEGEKHERAVLRHPYASACVIFAFSSFFFYSAIPAFVALLLFTFAVASSLFLLLDDPAHNGWWTVMGAWVTLVFLALHLLFAELPGLERISLPGEAAAVLLMCFWPLRHSPQNLAPGWATFVKLVSRFWILCCIVGLIAWSLQFIRSASILIDGSARMLLMTLAYRVVYDVFCGLIELGSTSPWAIQLNVFRTHRDLVVNRLELFLRWGLLLLWGRSMLRTYTIYGNLKEQLVQALDYSIHAGTLDLSLHSAVIFALGLSIALIAARLTRFALTEEVMPRTTLRIGGQAALTSSLYYVALGFGVFLTLAAAGIELGKIAILVSALGVGIGFGLQNIVSNFISGIILMIERPVNVGDKIQLEDMFGIVEKIGFRASRVRTFDGAEVIVPNSQLVADRVINWSLSDDRRRIEVSVGVKYGTDPEVVQRILLKVAQENQEILKLPEPDAIFVGFGESSLDFQLRGHTDNGSNWVVIRSQLNVAVNRELAAAGIEIPFPQRDLHLRSVDGEVVQLAGVRANKPETLDSSS